MIPGTTWKGMPSAARVSISSPAPEDEGIPPFEPQHPVTVLGQVRQEAVDLLLAHHVVVALLSHIDAAGVPAGHAEDGLGDQAVIDDDVRLLHQPQGPEGEQVRVAGTGAHQVDLPQVRIQGTGAELPLDGRLRLLDLSREDPLRHRALEDPVPEAPAVTLVAEASLDPLPVAGTELTQPPIAGRDHRLEPGPQEPRQHRRGLAGGDRHHHRVAVDDRGQEEGTGVRIIRHVDRDVLLAGQLGDAPVDHPIIRGRDHQPGTQDVGRLETARQVTDVAGLGPPRQSIREPWGDHRDRGAGAQQATDLTLRGGTTADHDAGLAFDDLKDG